MKFTSTQENLRKGLNVISSIAGKNVNLPILSNVLMRVDGSLLELVSTNLEIAVRCTVRGKAETYGEFTVPSKLLMEYVNLLPEGTVELAVDDQTLHVSCLKNSTSIKGIEASEFPLIPKVENSHVFHISTKDLKQALSQVTFAVSNVESRPELTGVLFNVNPAFAPGKMVLAATDSYRLSERVLSLENGSSGKSTDRPISIIVPGKTLNELNRILALMKEDETSHAQVEVAVGESQIVFRTGDIELISRIIDGRYPDYRPIIPDRFMTETDVPVNDLIRAVKGSSLFSRAGLQDVRLSFDPKEGIRVSSSDGQMGKNESVVEGKVTGAKNEITVNYRYLLDGLSAVNGDSVKVKMIDGMNPCVVTPTVSTEGFLYIVMPIKQ